MESNYDNLKRVKGKKHILLNFAIKLFNNIWFQYFKINNLLSFISINTIMQFFQDLHLIMVKIIGISEMNNLQ